MTYNTLGFMAQPLRSLRSAPYANCRRERAVRVLPCNAADLHADAHVWDFGSGEHFVCFGANEWKRGAGK